MPGVMRKKCSHFAPKNRCLQVPPGTCCHFTINSCPCFSPPHPRDAPGFLCTPDILHRPPQEPRQFLDRYRFGILVALQIQCIHLLALILVFFVLHTLKQNLIVRILENIGKASNHIAGFCIFPCQNSQRTVELDHIDRQTDNALEIRVARSKVIQIEFDSQLLKTGNRILNVVKFRLIPALRQFNRNFFIRDFILADDVHDILAEFLSAEFQNRKINGNKKFYSNNYRLFNHCYMYIYSN